MVGPIGSTERQKEMERKLSLPKVSDAVARDLEQRILEGSLKAGDRLAPERELAVELGVSRSSLREALQKLVMRGMLVRRQGEGTFVTDRLDAGFSDPWEEMLRDHPSVREDLLEIRHLLEAKAAECAAGRATDVDRERILHCLEQLEETFAGDDLDQQVERDLAFHQAIAEASHNAIIGHLTASLHKLTRDHIQRNLSELMRLPEARELLRQQHRNVWAGIERGNAEQARTAAAEHIDYVRERLTETLRRDVRRESALRRLGDG
jgi:GntR family transcriptional regulator, transcriptional repressor for pyruvate dehydrogenase complex